MGWLLAIEKIDRELLPAICFDDLAATNPEPVENHVMTDMALSSSAPILTLRVAEARVEDVGHAIARLAPADLQRMGARAGDVLKITGGMVGVGRAELSDDAFEGMIQIDGTCRSNCSAGLQEQVTVTPIEHQQAVAVRLSPLWVGAAPGDDCARTDARRSGGCAGDRGRAWYACRRLRRR